MARHLKRSFVRFLLAEDRKDRLAELRKAIKASGLTKSDFAHMIQVNVRTVRRWLADERAIDGPAATLFYLIATEPKLMIYHLDGGAK